MSGILRAMSEHGTLLEEMLARSEGGRDVLDELERASRLSETEAARKVGDENVQMYQEREGIIKHGSGKLPANFLGSPRPDDPDNSVRRRIASSYAWTIS
jgi:hypothetical protein